MRKPLQSPHMTPEVSIGTMTAAAVGTAIAPSISSGIGESFSASPAMEAGGAFMPKASFGDIFSQTEPFIASSQSTPEMPIAKTTDIFSTDGGWDILAMPAPKTNVPTDFSLDGFEPFTASEHIVKEGPAAIQEGEWTVVARNTDIKQRAVEPGESPSKAEPQTIPQIEPPIKYKPEQQVSAETVITLPEAEVRAIKDRVYMQGEQDLIRARALLAQLIAAEAKTEVGTEAQTEEEAKLKEEALVVYRRIQNKKKPEEDLVDKKPRKKKEEEEGKHDPDIPVLEVDLGAQEKRWEAFRRAISNTFFLARLLRKKSIDPKDIAGRVTEKRETKSKLLSQINWDKLPDGSFHEAVEDASNINTINDLSVVSERETQRRVADILDNKRPVKIREDDFTQDKATKREAKRVLKFARILSWD